MELLGPALSQSPPLLPRRAGARGGPAAGGLPPGEPPAPLPLPILSHGRKALPAGPSLRGSFHPACTASVGLAPLPSPVGLAGPRGAGRPGRARGASPRGGPQRFSRPLPEAAAPQSLAPPKKRVWSSGRALHYVIFERGRQTARSAVVFATANPDCAEISRRIVRWGNRSNRF